MDVSLLVHTLTLRRLIPDYSCRLPGLARGPQDGEPRDTEGVARSSGTPASSQRHRERTAVCKAVRASGCRPRGHLESKGVVNDRGETGKSSHTTTDQTRNRDGGGVISRRCSGLKPCLTQPCEHTQYFQRARFTYYRRLGKGEPGLAPLSLNEEARVQLMFERASEPPVSSKYFDTFDLDVSESTTR